MDHVRKKDDFTTCKKIRKGEGHNRNDILKNSEDKI